MTWSPRPWVAVVALVASLVAPTEAWSPDVPTKTISVANGGPWGEWGEPEFCPRGSYAVGFQLKVDQPRGFFGDNTGLNAVRLLCQGEAVATSSQGPRGSWTPAQRCPRGRRLDSFRLRVEPPKSFFGDDTAANNLDVTCDGGEVLEGPGGLGGIWGNWSQPCPTLGGGVCGIRTRLEPPRRGFDDTGLNDVQLYCCP